MARGCYPRHGHRLAPVALREMLMTPLPARFESGEGPRLLLADLDEAAWGRFGEAVCRELAEEVVRTVGAAARAPISIADRRLPAIPVGLRLEDLDLEVRTRNALVAAGISRRPQDLATLTIEGILGLRGFWVKCLVDLLTSLEYAIEHPETRLSRRDSEEADQAVPSPGHYPRFGERVSPEALREVLDAVVPDNMARETPAQGIRLCQLDETVWDRMSPDLIRRLADLVVARVNATGCSRAIQDRRLPPLSKTVRLEELSLEKRTYNCLRKAGYTRRPEKFGKATIGDLLAIPAFGARCLVDLLSAMETVASRRGKFDPRLTAEAEALSALPDARRVQFSDPRLGPQLRAIDAEADTVAELAARVMRRSADPPDPARLAQQLGSVRSRIECLRKQTLEGELTAIFSSENDPRDGRIVAEYYGWNGQGGATLEELGEKYGLSRERIRQVCFRAVRRVRGIQVFAPVLDRISDFIAERLPIVVDTLHEESRAAGLVDSQLPLGAIERAVQFLGRKKRFAVVPLDDAWLVVCPECSDMPRAVVQAARRAMLNVGIVTIRGLTSELSALFDRKVDPALVLTTLKTVKDFHWLNESKDWFRLGIDPQYGLPNLIEKVLAVAGRIDVGLLRAAVARYRRKDRNLPPNGVLLRFCRDLPGISVRGRVVSADPPRDWRHVLTGVEAGIVRVLDQYGPVLDRGEFEERCVAEGMNRFSFNAMVMSSPVVVQHGRSVYGLVGSRLDRRTLRVLKRKRRDHAPARVLCGFARSEDGRVHLTYCLSKAAIAGGVVTIPAALKEQLRGQFVLRSPEGLANGTMVCKEGCAWGLGPVLRGQNASPGDRLKIILDLCTREAVSFLNRVPNPQAIS